MGEAAERLKVSDRYVRRLVEDGDVPARRLGESWFIDERALARRARRAPGIGRTWAPRTAWAPVDLLAGG
ncbi:helix-turn-helix domain-containing protein, partial [Micrococcus luteus]|nr:helix-turn-helix domain-containing protein [Micrococcus luteus]